MIGSMIKLLVYRYFGVDMFQLMPNYLRSMVFLVSANSNLNYKNIVENLLLILLFTGVLLICIGFVLVQQDWTEEAKVRRANLALLNCKIALEKYCINSGFYPTNKQGLLALVKKPITGKIPIKYPEKGYIKNISYDPWGKPFFYDNRNDNLTILSYGQDGIINGTGLNTDIIYTLSPCSTRKE